MSKFYQRWTKPSPDKVRAIKECGVPWNKEAVLLGMASYLDNFIRNYAATREETKFYWGKQEETVFGKIQDSISSDETKAFFDPSKPIILLTEASIHEGLSAALLQKSNRHTTSTLHQLNNDREGEEKSN